MNTRISNFIDVGDPGAPIGSAAWCKASHLQLCATKRQADTDVRHLKFHLVDFKEKQRWKLLTNNENEPFRSWEEYLTYPEPNGLGISKKNANAIMKAVDGELIGEVLGKHPGRTDNTRDEKGQYLSKDSNTTIGRGAAYILARLDRDGHTELAAKVRTGKMSANAAAKQLNWRKEPTPLETILKLVPQLTDAEWQQVMRARRKEAA